MVLTDAIAWVAIVVAGFAAYFTAMQWKSAERSADAAERSAQAAEQAVRIQEELARAEAANTAIALVSAERSAVASEQSAVSARSLVEIGERPWVSRKATGAAARALPNGGLHLDIVSELHNAGKSPAFNLISRQAFGVIAEVPETLTYPLGPNIAPESVLTLGPDMSCRISVTASLAPSQMIDLHGGNAILCVYGHSTYDDFLNIAHVTNWCLKYLPATNTFTVTSRHNRMT